jgi:hypothetical protein
MRTAITSLAFIGALVIANNIPAEIATAVGITFVVGIFIAGAYAITKAVR